jgi:hypothetical protein
LDQVGFCFGGGNGFHRLLQVDECSKNHAFQVGHDAFLMEAPEGTKAIYAGILRRHIN